MSMKSRACLLGGRSIGFSWSGLMALMGGSGNILDKRLLSEFEEGYEGFYLGVEVLKTRIVFGKCQDFLQRNGRPQSENSWVEEKLMKKKLVDEFGSSSLDWVRGPYAVGLEVLRSCQGL